jgi:hypothetical protein
VFAESKSSTVIDTSSLACGGFVALSALEIVVPDGGVNGVLSGIDFNGVVGVED